MEFINHDLLCVIRAVIASKEIPKKRLARICCESQPRISEMLHGDRKMPVVMQEKILKELGIKDNDLKELFELRGILF